MRFLTVSALALIASASATWADDALIIGTDQYDALDRFRRGAEVVDATDALSDAGYDVLAAADASGAEIAVLVRRFSLSIPGSDRVIVALAGRFATDGARTWYVPRDYSDPRIDTIGQSGLSVETLMLLLADTPGGAVLVLSTDTDAQEVYDAWLTEGIGDLDIPQGVSVVQGGPRNVARFLSNDLAQPQADIGARLAENENLTATGFVPRSLQFTGPVAGQPQIDVTPLISETERAAERALWDGAVALDTEAAYVNYLQRYPNGAFASDAQAARDVILNDPDRGARRAEEALLLSREDQREIQRALTLLTFNTRGIDGIFGPGTRGAITNWQQQNGFAQTGFLTAEQVARIDAQSVRRAEQIEAEAERQRQIAITQDRAFWDETGAGGDEVGLRAYLSRYPDGQFADAARTRVAAIDAERGRLAAAEERTLWQRAEAADTVPGYQIYLEQYPQGSFANAATARVEELSVEEDGAAARDAARAIENALGLNQLTRQVIETRLESLGLEPGVVDGEFDRDTRRAIRRFQRDREMERTGFLDEQSVVLLLANGP